VKFPGLLLTTYCSKSSCSPSVLAAALLPGARCAISRPNKLFKGSRQAKKCAVLKGRPIPPPCAMGRAGGNTRCRQVTRTLLCDTRRAVNVRTFRLSLPFVTPLLRLTHSGCCLGLCQFQVGSERGVDLVPTFISLGRCKTRSEYDVLL